MQGQTRPWWHMWLAGNDSSERVKIFIKTIMKILKWQTQKNSHTFFKKKIKFSSYIRKFRVEQLQSHIWLAASSYMGKYLRISSYIRKPFLINDFATAPVWISLYMRKILFYFLSVWSKSGVRTWFHRWCQWALDAHWVEWAPAGGASLGCIPDSIDGASERWMRVE